MARQLRIEHEIAVCHVDGKGKRKEGNIFLENGLPEVQEISCRCSRKISLHLSLLYPEEVLEHARDALINPEKFEEVRIEKNEIFNKYCDGMSSMRVCEYLKSQVGVKRENFRDVRKTNKIDFA